MAITKYRTSISQEDQLGFKPSASETEEVYRVLNPPFSPGPYREREKDIDLIYFMPNRLMIQATKKDQVNVIRYLLEE